MFLTTGTTLCSLHFSFNLLLAPFAICYSIQSWHQCRPMLSLYCFFFLRLFSSYVHWLLILINFLNHFVLMWFHLTSLALPSSNLSTQSNLLRHSHQSLALPSSNLSMQSNSLHHCCQFWFFLQQLTLSCIFPCMLPFNLPLFCRCSIDMTIRACCHSTFRCSVVNLSMR